MYKKKKSEKNPNEKLCITVKNKYWEKKIITDKTDGFFLMPFSQ